MSKVIDIIESKDIKETPEEVIARLPKEKLKTLFYLFSGKPDSRIKIYNSPVFINQGDIVELNDCVSRKLQTHNVDAQITSVSVGYVGEDIQEFGTWAEFYSHPWQEPEQIEEIVVKWDFMVKLPSYEIPQRHTLMIRISSDVKPGKFLQMMVSGNSDDFDKMDMLAAPAFCRVDFINAQISKELVNVVTDWYKGRKTPTLIPDFYYWLKKRKTTIAKSIHHLLPFSFMVTWIALCLWGVKNVYENDIAIHIVGIWVFLGYYLLTPASEVGHYFASKAYNELSEIEGSKVVFDFTSGDKKKNGSYSASSKGALL